MLSLCQDKKLDIRQIILHLKKDARAILDKLQTSTRQAKKEMFDKLERRLGKESTDIASLERIVNSMDPKNVLKRGYSITTVNGNVIKSAGQVKEGDIIHTLLGDGSIVSETKSVKKQEDL